MIAHQYKMQNETNFQRYQWMLCGPDILFVVYYPYFSVKVNEMLSSGIMVKWDNSSPRVH